MRDVVGASGNLSGLSPPPQLHLMKSKRPKPRSRINPQALALAQAVDSALSTSGEYNHFSASHSLREIKTLARAVLRQAKAAR